MVWMTSVDSTVVALGRLGQHAIWFNVSDYSTDLATQIEIGDDSAILKAEPVQFGDAEYLGSGSLLESARLRDLFASDCVV